DALVVLQAHPPQIDPPLTRYQQRPVEAGPDRLSGGPDIPDHQRHRGRDQQRQPEQDPAGPPGAGSGYGRRGWRGSAVPGRWWRVRRRWLPGWLRGVRRLWRVRRGWPARGLGRGPRAGGVPPAPGAGG